MNNRLNLSTITLIMVDCVDFGRVKKSFDRCVGLASFADARILTSLPVDDPAVVKIPPITSLEAYSRFMITELWRYVDTEHVLVGQWDGFIWKPELWTDEFLDYDYIGAPWKLEWLFPGVPKTFTVGNGGFSLRSARLCEFLATDERLTWHPLEDVMICQLNRAYLECRGFRFAPEDLARRFSWESGDYREAFGVHHRLTLA